MAPVDDLRVQISGKVIFRNLADDGIGILLRALHALDHDAVYTGVLLLAIKISDEFLYLTGL